MEYTGEDFEIMIEIDDADDDCCCGGCCRSYMYGVHMGPEPEEEYDGSPNKTRLWSSPAKRAAARQALNPHTPSPLARGYVSTRGSRRARSPRVQLEIELIRTFLAWERMNPQD